MPVVTFHPSGKTVAVPGGTPLSRACREAGVALDLPCGERGVCGKCRVRVLAGEVAADARQKALLPAGQLAAGWRCACVAEVRGDVTVEEPPARGDGGVIVTEFLVGEPDGGCDGGGLGLAVDLGTTTLAAALCDLENGTVLALAGRANPQAAHGDDVVSRLAFALEGAEQAAELRRLAMGAIEELAERVLAEAGRKDALERIVVAGNTVMQHLFLGLDVRSLAVAPFAVAFAGPADLDAATAGWRGGGRPRFLIPPSIGPFAGGDVTAGLLAHRVAALPGNTLYLDIGTNGEIALSSRGALSVCAAAAGPAFEGARIARGMRAEAGAIAGVRLGQNGKLETVVLGGGGTAAGICGSGLLDAAAVLLDTGLMDEGGRLLARDEAEALAVTGDLASRVGESDSGPFFRLDGEGGVADGVVLTQRDLRELQLVKGAMAAGVRVLLAEAGIAAEELDAVLLAGGFGCRLNPASALRIGLLPPGIALERVRAVGNASLAGARFCLLAARERDRAVALSRSAHYIELSGRADFATFFAGEMLFP